MKSHPTASRGFTLLEMIVVVAILAMIAGIVVPVAGVVLRQANTDETVRRLDRIGEAVEAYFEDTFAFPSKLLDLADDPGVAGWAGPYLVPGYVADETGLADVEVDGFRTPFQVTVLDADRLRIRSFGPDRKSGGGDDLDRVVNVAPIRRARTIERIAIFNSAILAYNRNRGTGQPALPPDVQKAQALLVQYGYLPDDPDLRIDGWGDPLVPDPPGAAPLVAVTSTHLGGGSSGGGKKSGSGKKKKKKGKKKHGKGGKKH